MVMLALLYLGGLYGHLSGAAFPILGSGDKAYNQFQGKAQDPIYPTITVFRHLPLVKPVVVSPLYAVDQQLFEHTVEFHVVPFPTFTSSLLVACPLTWGERSPPQS